MAIIEINLNPSKQELKWFGLILLVFFALVGGIVWGAATAPRVAGAIVALGAALCVAYYAVAPLRLPMYLGWMHLVFPIGWVMSHLLFGAIYYLILTPIGLTMRLIGHDALRRHRPSGAVSYWMKRPAADSDRYFRQF
jgi:hypothetical protein